MCICTTNPVYTQTYVKHPLLFGKALRTTHATPPSPLPKQAINPEASTAVNCPTTPREIVKLTASPLLSRDQTSTRPSNSTAKSMTHGRALLQRPQRSEKGSFSKRAAAARSRPVPLPPRQPAGCSAVRFGGQRASRSPDDAAKGGGDRWGRLPRCRRAESRAAGRCKR